MTKQLQSLKRPWRLIAIFAFAWMIMLQGYSQTCGSVTNSGFENNLTGWSVSTGATATIVTDVHGGTRAVRIGTAEGGVNSAGVFAVTAGQQLTFQVWAKISGSPAWAGVGLDFLNASGTEISEINLQITSTSYALRTVTQAVPAGATQARIWSWKSGSTGNLFLDDFCITTPDTQAPSVPTGLSSSSVTQNSFTLNWTTSTDNVAVTGYEVFRNGTSIGTPSGNSFNVSGLAAGTTYAMTVRARDAAGNFSAQSAALNVTTSAPPVTSCGSLTNNGFENGLNGWTNNGNTAISTDRRSGANAAVTGPGDGGLHYGSLTPAINGQSVVFKVWAKITGSPSFAGVGIDYLDASGTELSEEVIDITTAAYTEYIVNSTAPAGTANIHVWTWKAGTGSLFMDDFCLTVSGSGTTDTQAPTVPTGLSASNVTSSGFTLSWSASTDNVGVTGYEVFRNGTSIGTPTGTSLNVTSLTASTTYAMTVRARDAAGNRSAASAALNVTTSNGGGNGGPFTITINKSQQFQTIDGFGFFGAQNVWWSGSSSLWSDSWGDQVISDLGITIWRTEHYPPSDNLHTQDADWNKQLPVVRGLKNKASQHGVDLKFIFTVWSPPSSMKVRVDNNTRMIGQPHPDGTKNGGALDPTKYTAFANFLKQGIQRFADEGINVYAISPQNEPFFVHSFNSCWYKQEWYPEMLVNVIPQVKATYPNVKIFGSEGMLEMEAADHNWQWFYHKQILDNQQARNNVDILAVHGYQDGVAPTSGSELGHLWTNHRTIFAEPMGKPQWMTETSGYEDSWSANPGAFSLALDIMSALNNGNVSGWVWWQGSENPGSQGIGEYALMNGSVKGKKYYASKQFYRYIRPGAVRIGASSTNNAVAVSAYQHTANGTHTIVLANTSNSAQNVTVGGANLPASFTIFRTSASDNCANIGSYTTGTTLSLPARSLVTLQAGGTPLGSGGAGARSAVGNHNDSQELATAEEAKHIVYPNPASAQGLTIDVSGLQRTSDDVQISLNDLSGKQVSQFTTKLNKLELRREELPAKGIYLLKVNTGAVIKRVKVMIE